MRKLLKAAVKSNRHVVEYLVGQKRPAMELPDHYGVGDDNEALIYVSYTLAAWKDTAGAIAWLRSVAYSTPKDSTPPAKGPLGFIKTWLKDHLPIEKDVWQVDARQLPSWIGVAGQPIRPWTVLVLSCTSGLVLQHEVLQDEPSMAKLWDFLAQAMQNPIAGEPHRPTEIEVPSAGRWEPLTPHLQAIDVALTVCDEFDEFDGAFKEMCAHLDAEPEPGILDMPGIDVESVRRMYAAAADYFRAAPWRRVGFESAIRIESPGLKSGPWYGVLMGQSGMTRGIALYENLAALRRLLTEDDDDHHDGTREAVCTSVIFGEEWDARTRDVDAAKKYGWPIARPDAWPSVFHKERGLALRQPLAWELSMVEACLRVVPEFVRTRRQDDATPMTITVDSATGPMEIVLSWVQEQRVS